MKKILLLFLLASNAAFSQSINDYQYVMVPAKFDAFKENDKYNLNTNVKLMLQKYGFIAYFPTEAVPFEVANSNCKKLNADLIKDNGLMTTKVKIVLKDCKDNIVYETDYGKSIEKDYARAYMEALRDAAKSFDKLKYKYNGKNGLTTESGVEAVAPVTNVEPNIPSGDKEIFYFAQPTSNGFQVVNNEPRVIMKLFNTSEKNVFLATKDGKTGLVMAKNGQWLFEYQENGKVFSEPMRLRF